ncbi:hypothetical protein IMG5_139910 [Ichthyophthirius multifiliis]|uniref:Transmembrane protein n=1 Tax=Ichthyophthirius multifiliis TaxID=5932 RepID=G0QX98_ICHMU|nr:hypothetical protein IMG5_139910 [Ichthyophthirius multifiliis]EGR30156.1 hypothetical protein IMG5_139910 [Ichthyophthirius multifiliis]|eukprot:XP_004031392.1 hypothetical protein IMG5_139910 [Ichthyophthirius multifiliis]
MQNKQMETNSPHFIRVFIKNLLKIIIYYSQIVFDIISLTLLFQNEIYIHSIVLAIIIAFSYFYKFLYHYKLEYGRWIIKLLFEIFYISQILRCFFPEFYQISEKQFQKLQGIQQSGPSLFILIHVIFYLDFSHLYLWISIGVSFLNLYYSNLIYFLLLNNDFENSKEQIKTQFYVILFSQYSSRICLWAVFCYILKPISVWTTIGCDFLCCILIYIFKIYEKQTNLLCFYDYMFCFRFYELQFFTYEGYEKSKRYYNLKEFYRFIVQLTQIIIIILYYSKFGIIYQYMDVKYVLEDYYFIIFIGGVIFFIFNQSQNFSRILYVQQSESQTIQNYKNRIRTQQNQIEKLQFEINKVQPELSKQQEEILKSTKNQVSQQQYLEDLQNSVQTKGQEIENLKKKIEEQNNLVDLVNDGNLKQEKIILKFKEDNIQLQNFIEKLQKDLEKAKMDINQLQAVNIQQKNIIKDLNYKNEKILQDLQFMNNSEEFPITIAKNLENQLKSLKEQNENSEKRFNNLYSQYQKKENELKESLYRQALNDININNNQSFNIRMKNENDFLQQKISQKDELLIKQKNDIIDLFQKNEELQKKIKSYEKQIHKIQRFDEEIYKQQQYTNLNLKVLESQSVIIQKQPDIQYLNENIKKIVFHQFIDQEISQNILKQIKFPYFLKFKYDKSCQKFNQIIYIFVNGFLFIYQKNSWSNTNFNTYQIISKIIQQCKSLLVLEVNIEKYLIMYFQIYK